MNTNTADTQKTAGIDSIPLTLSEKIAWWLFAGMITYLVIAQ